METPTSDALENVRQLQKHHGQLKRSGPDLDLLGLSSKARRKGSHLLAPKVATSRTLKSFVDENTHLACELMRSLIPKHLGCQINVATLGARGQT